MCAAAVFLPSGLDGGVNPPPYAHGPRKGPFFYARPAPSDPVLLVFGPGDDKRPQLSSPVDTFLFSGVSFMPAASAMVSANAAKSFCARLVRP